MTIENNIFNNIEVENKVNIVKNKGDLLDKKIFNFFLNLIL